MESFRHLHFYFSIALRLVGLARIVFRFFAPFGWVSAAYLFWRCEQTETETLTSKVGFRRFRSHYYLSTRSLSESQCRVCSIWCIIRMRVVFARAARLSTCAGGRLRRTASSVIFMVANIRLTFYFIKDRLSHRGLGSACEVRTLSYQPYTIFTRKQGTM